MSILSLLNRHFTSDKVTYAVKDGKQTVAEFHTREEARAFKRAFSKAISKPQSIIVVHGYSDGLLLPERVVS